MEDPLQSLLSAMHLLEQSAVDQAFLWASLTLTGLSVLAGTALRSFRWARLEKLLGPERFARTERILRREQELLDSVLLMRVVGASALILTLPGVIGDGAPARPSAALDTFLAQLGVILLIFLGLIHGLLRSLALAVPERIVMLTLPYAEFLRVVLKPVHWAWAGMLAFFQRALGLEERNGEEAGEARDEILDKVYESEHEGAIDDEERDMIESIIEFRSQDVSEVMTPRTEVVALEVETSFEEAIRVIEQSGHSRIPVWEGSIDNVVGIVYAKDLLARVAGDGAARPELRGLLRAPKFIPETTKVSGLLRGLRKDQIHLAIVLDEYGGMSGLVTIEDVLEEIVGEILDEYDHHEGAQEDPILRSEDGSASLSAKLRIDEVNEAFALELPEEEGYDTLGGFLFSRLGHIPKPGEVLEVENVRFTVQDADARKIKRVHLVFAES